MFGLFKKRNPKDILMEQYKKLIEEAYTLSKINRTASDQKTAEANEILKQIEQLEK